RDLVLGEARIDVAVMHIPPLDPSGIRNGGWSSRLEAERFLAALAARGTRLLLAGHLHGHEEETDAGGVRTVVSGGGARSNQRLDGVGLHYLIVTVAPDGAVDVERRPLDP